MNFNIYDKEDTDSWLLQHMTRSSQVIQTITLLFFEHRRMTAMNRTDLNMTSIHLNSIFISSWESSAACN